MDAYGVIHLIGIGHILYEISRVGTMREIETLDKGAVGSSGVIGQHIPLYNRVVDSLREYLIGEMGVASTVEGFGKSQVYIRAAIDMDISYRRRIFIYLLVCEPLAGYSIYNRA